MAEQIPNGVKTEYKKWFKQMTEYGFTEGEDFSSFLSGLFSYFFAKRRNEFIVLYPTVGLTKFDNVVTYLSF